MPKDEPKQEKEKITVTVLSRFQKTTYPKINIPLEMTHITYVGAGLAPRMIKIPTADYSPEMEKATIKADIERRLAEPAESYEI